MERKNIWKSMNVSIHQIANVTRHRYYNDQTAREAKRIIAMMCGDKNFIMQITSTMPHNINLKVYKKVSKVWLLS